MSYPLQPASVVLSKAGRDAGRHFAVLKAEDNFALIADGKLRPAERPKRKKRMHLHVTPHVLPEIAELLVNGQTVENHHLRKALKAWETREQTPRAD